ncbi:aldo/keto reductase [Brevibacillus choshinensis]|uniref:Aldo/keto reductase n=1 Tax=Brevibacillus choshinensis TaxID=54911 RepID=A0ABX7FRJ4_BRECH|nr:aldo/keto reductase [Brevibacillus choshinensis]QRG68878.1 aldo/keto reductase [Brevibacillus choshinensis]
MKTTRLGSSDLMVTEVGFGCMTVGTDETKAVALIQEALERGINFLDTSDLYEAGRNEELVGKAIQGRRDKVILATKVGNRRIPGQDGWVWDPSKAYILSAVKESLRRLQTDYIDLYQLHGGTLDDPIDETIEAFEQLKREGVIRHYGISSIRPNVIREYAARSSIVSVMNQYSILDRRAEEEVLPMLQARGISVIARGPVASGALAENKKVAKGYLDYSMEEIVAVREKLAPLVNRTRSMSQLAIRYSLSHPAVATVIPGASSREQLLQNIEAVNVPPLTAEEIAAIRSFSKASRYELHR